MRRPERTTLSAGVAEEIIQAIASGELEPGTRMLQAGLARHLRVSQSTIREAHQLLERWGLVSKDIGGRSFVTELSVKDLQECYSLRIRIEPMVAGRAYECANKMQLKELAGLYEEMCQAVGKRDFVQMSKADIAFHEYIWKMSGSKWFVNTLRDICLPLMGFQAIRVWKYPHYDFKAFLDGGHLPLLNAMKDGPSAGEVEKIFVAKLKDYCDEETRIIGEEWWDDRNKPKPRILSASKTGRR